MRDEPRHETLVEVQRLLARARPEQVRRLLDDIRDAGAMSDRDERASPQRRVS
ncbi:MAG: hypothetical protein ACU0CB_00240 [Roseovarius sp.]|uniref:hypothetical protein n=1 Tax=Roseovarius sp. TaxID=1486281 RepID=UPI002601648D|nr:hypothetical protein [Roseovarius sp.]